jgi:hypothetical protein
MFHLTPQSSSPTLVSPITVELAIEYLLPRTKIQTVLNFMGKKRKLLDWFSLMELMLDIVHPIKKAASKLYDDGELSNPQHFVTVL